MKKYISFLLCLFSLTPTLYAQGVTSPDGTFSADGTTDLTLRTGTTTRLTILNANGYAGIGITPTEMLHINGNALSVGSFLSTAGTFGSTGSSNLSFTTSGTTRMTILNSNGRVGIGLATPTEMLDVNGDILSEQVSASTGNFNSRGTNNLSLLTNGTSRLTILNSNGFVGIGTATPSELLHVNGNVLSSQFLATTGTFGSTGSSNLSFLTNGTSRLTILNATGRMGIGTATPQAMLHVKGDNLIMDGSASPVLYTGSGATDLNRYLLLTNSVENMASSGLKAGGVLVADDYGYASPSKNNLVVKGRVSIGTPITASDNDYTLAVNGRIGTKDIQVETTSNAWPDFVFSANYHLPTLYEVEKYIKENNHLQDVPSAQEIEKKHDLGEMDAVLLKKIEELTLYIIEQQKQIDELKNKLEAKD